MPMRILFSLLLALALCLAPTHSGGTSPQSPENHLQIVSHAQANPEDAQDSASTLDMVLVGQPRGVPWYPSPMHAAEIPSHSDYGKPEISVTSPLTSTPNLELLGHIGGSASGLAIQGDYAYMGEGPRLTVLNISNAITPTLAGQSELLSYTTWDIAIHDDYVYAAAYKSGLHIFDVRNPSNPQEVGSISITGSAIGVTISDTIAYVAAGRGGVGIIDVSNPAQPTEITYYAPAPYLGSTGDVQISGSIVYIIDDGLQIIDVTDPAHPIHVGGLEIDGYPESLDIHGQFAYITDFHGGRYVIDVSNPANPSEVGHYTTTTDSYYRDIQVEGNYAFIAIQGRNGGFEIIDISDPANPHRASFHSEPRNSMKIFVQESRLFALDSFTGLWKFDISNPAQPVSTSLYRIIGLIHDIYTRDGIAYIAAGPNGLYAFDISNPASMIMLSRTEHIQESGPNVNALAIEGNLAYLADRFGMTILDISNPAHPAEVGLFPTSRFTTAVSVSENKAYLGTYDYYPDDYAYLDIVDVSTPANPSLTAQYDPRSGSIRSIVVANQTAFLATGYKLKIIGISNPAQPVHIYDYLVGERVFGVQLAGNLAYLPGDGLRFVDITTPSQPTEVGHYRGFEQWEAYDVAVSGHIACIVASSLSAPSRLIVLDVGNTYSAHPIGTAETIFNLRTVYIEGDQIYAGGSEGLYVYKLNEHNVHLPIIHR